MSQESKRSSGLTLVNNVHWFQRVVATFSPLQKLQRNVARCVLEYEVDHRCSIVYVHSECDDNIIEVQRRAVIVAKCNVDHGNL